MSVPILMAILAAEVANQVIEKCYQGQDGALAIHLLGALAARSCVLALLLPCALKSAKATLTDSLKFVRKWRQSKLQAFIA